MTNAQFIPFQPDDPSQWTDPPDKVSDALDELSGRAQGALFDAYDNAGALPVAGSFVTINLIERTSTETALFGLSSDILTLNQSGGGTVDISYRATLATTGTGDYGFDVHLARSTDGGSTFTNIPGTLLKGGKGT